MDLSQAIASAAGAVPVSVAIGFLMGLFAAATTIAMVMCGRAARDGADVEFELRIAWLALIKWRITRAPLEGLDEHRLPHRRRRWWWTPRRRYAQADREVAEKLRRSS